MDILKNTHNSQIIKLENLNIGYRSKTAVHDINITMCSGQVLCVLGPNGSGKSTLFKTILGLIESISGNVEIDNQPLSAYSSLQLAQVLAYVPQAIQEFFDFEVIQVVLMGRLARLSSFANPGANDYKIAKQCLQQLGIQHLENRSYMQLSGGERQLVLIARALAQEPKAIIMDEPTSSLDFGNQIKVLQVIQNLKQKDLSIMLSTHNPQHAATLADKVILIKNNKVYKSGATDNVLTKSNLQHLYDLTPNQAQQHLKDFI